jgi:hypothetical protein
MNDSETQYLRCAYVASSQVVTVSEKLLALAILRCLEHEKAVVEGGGAAGLAALLPGGPLDIPELKGKRIAVPLCGGVYVCVCVCVCMCVCVCVLCERAIACVPETRFAFCLASVSHVLLSYAASCGREQVCKDLQYQSAHTHTPTQTPTHANAQTHTHIHTHTHTQAIST